MEDMAVKRLKERQLDLPRQREGAEVSRGGTKGGGRCKMYLYSCSALECTGPFGGERERRKGERVTDGQRGRRNIWKVSGTSLPVS